jgi:hypothetical protein
MAKTELIRLTWGGALAMSRARFFHRAALNLADSDNAGFVLTPLRGRQ